MSAQPQVRRYDEPTGERSVHVALQEGAPAAPLASWGTVDMSRFPTGLTTADGRELRVELLGVARRDYELMGNALASCAFNVAAGLLVPRPDAIAADAIAVNDDGGGVCRHAMLVLPFLWGEDGIAPLHKELTTTTWLQVIPITDAERELAESEGASSLAERFEATGTDVLDPAGRSQTAL